MHKDSSGLSHHSFKQQKAWNECFCVALLEYTISTSRYVCGSSQVSSRVLQHISGGSRTQLYNLSRTKCKTLVLRTLRGKLEIWESIKTEIGLIISNWSWYEVTSPLQDLLETMLGAETQVLL
jgi:hypothetical protein